MNALTRDLIKLVDMTEEMMKEKGQKEGAGYREKLHLMPPVGWLNDPNGLCQLNGIYHAFFQYSPFNAEGGVKMWGHYTSKDMIDWEYQGGKLYPDQPFDCHGVYSGSAFIEDDKMYVYYTGNVKLEDGDFDYINTGRESNTVLVVSEDGKTFGSKKELMRNVDYPSDLTCHVRDPKVWKDGDTYYMIQGARTKEDVGQALIFGSKDKINWKFRSRVESEKPFGYMWECPDLFPIEYKGKNVWVLVVSMTKASEDDHCKMQYFLGDFDGEKFLCTCPSDEPRWLDEGFDNYAAVTFQNAKDVLLMGWGMNWQYAAQTPTEEYCGQATLARKLSLTEVDGVLTLAAAPAGLEKFRHSSYPIENHTTIRTETFGLKISGKGDAKICLKNSVGQKLKIYVSDTKITVDRTMAGYKEFSEHFMTEKYSISTAARKKDGAWNLELVFDVSILELFAEDGVDAISTVVYPETPYDRVSWKGDLSVELYEIDA